MDLESLGGGGISGFVVALVGVFGFSRRLSKLENEKVNKDVCELCKKDSDARLDRIENKIDRLLERGS
jgi:ribosomal protein L37AE/L43A